MADRPHKLPQPAKICFIICPIGDARSEIRDRSDQILEYVVKPVVEPLGYTVKRADTLGEPGTITRQIIDLLQSAALVIADLSTQNPNVMYELAIRHAVRKPLVQLIAKGERIPFDVASARTIQFDWRDLRSVDDCKHELRTQIEAVERDPSLVDNPITSAIDLGSAQRSGDQTDLLLLRLFDQMELIQRRLDDVQEEMATRPVPPPRSFVAGRTIRPDSVPRELAHMVGSDGRLVPSYQADIAGVPAPLPPTST